MLNIYVCVLHSHEAIDSHDDNSTHVNCTLSLGYDEACYLYQEGQFIIEHAVIVMAYLVVCMILGKVSRDEKFPDAHVSLNKG